MEKIRYAVVGAGWISQAAFMPGVHHTGNSEMTALVSGSPEKARELSRKYGIRRVYGYEQYDQLLRSGEIDAAYIALPNDMHHDYAVRTLRAGVHLLLEKPMARSEEECLAIIAAAKESGAKLMIAYRLHFEPGTLKVLELVCSGEIGEPKFFSSVFCQVVSAENHRADPRYWAGPLADMGPYPINAIRNLFRADPTEIFSFRNELKQGVDSMISVLLKFPAGKLGQFMVGYGENSVDEFRIVGTRGDIRMSPAFGFGEKLKIQLTQGEETREIPVPETDQFGGETRYFSDCILKNREPEPGGDEGLADIRIIQAIEESLRSGELQKIQPVVRSERPGLAQVARLEPVESPPLVGAADPRGGGNIR